MSTKYVFVTGGVVSGLGKGITAASLGRLLKARHYNVTMQKFDPYLNVDPGTMNPVQHGEVYVTDDGAETDLDLGHYERFINESLSKESNVTSGKVFWSVLQKERKGEYGGGTVQIIPHVTNEIKSRFYVNTEDDLKIAIIEIGGTVGDIESQPFLESIRQFKHEIGEDNVCLVHVTLVPYLNVSGELKTKPTQMSVKELQAMGLQPDVIIARCEHTLESDVREKISRFCNVKPECVLENRDLEYLYEVPLVMEEEGFASVVLEKLKLEDRQVHLRTWKMMVDNMKNPDKEVKVAIVGKYISLHDAYISVVEALKHAGFKYRAKINIKWVDSEYLTYENVKDVLGDIDGIVVPGGFGNRGIEGKIVAINYARVNLIPFLGLCLGMQLSIIEYARNVLGYSDANSTEINADTTHPMIHIMPDKDGLDLGGTLRLGSYPCVLDKNSRAYSLYQEDLIHERHRHRYEVNNEYRDELSSNGLSLVGISPDGRIVEMCEIKDHPFFIATQAHPELKSRPNHPHPLFVGLIEACLSKKQ